MLRRVELDWAKGMLQLGHHTQCRRRRYQDLTRTGDQRGETPMQEAEEWEWAWEKTSVADWNSVATLEIRNCHGGAAVREAESVVLCRYWQR
jgi:hypothetical protein